MLQSRRAPLRARFALRRSHLASSASHPKNELKFNLLSSNRGRAAFLYVKETPPGRIFPANRPEMAAFGGQQPQNAVDPDAQRRAFADPGHATGPPACLARTRTQLLPSPLSSMAATPLTSKTSMPATKPTRIGRCEWRTFFAEPEGRPDERREERAGSVLEEAGLAADRRTANWSQRSTATGPRPKRRSATRSRARRRRAASNSFRADVQQATRDSIRALMLIRAYRMRGHFHAKLDPLGLEPEKNEEELDPRSYGFTEADLDRKIFLDHVLGLEFAHAARDRHDPAPHLLPDARRRIHAHLRSAAEGAGSRSASKARTRRSPSRAKASARS